MTQLANTVSYADLTDTDRQNGVFLDIREADRPRSGSIDEDINIPLRQLRERLSELPQNKTIYIIERKGLGPYNATRVLAGQGFSVKIVTE